MSVFAMSGVAEGSALRLNSLCKVFPEKLQDAFDLLGL